MTDQSIEQKDIVFAAGSPPPPPDNPTPELVERKSGFAERLQALRLSVNHLLANESESLAVSTEIPELTPEEIPKNATELEKQVESFESVENLKPKEFISKSTSLISKADFMSANYSNQIKALDSQVEAKRVERSGVAMQVMDIEDIKGIKRATLFVKERILKAKKVLLLDAQIREMENKKGTLSEEEYSVATVLRTLKERRQQIILGEVEAMVEKIRDQYVGFVYETMEDKPLLTEVQNAYIKKHVEPILEDLLSAKRSQTDKKARVLPR